MKDGAQSDADVYTNQAGPHIKSVQIGQPRHPGVQNCHIHQLTPKGHFN